MIRCEACSTLYELDETLLAASGSQVQCTKCEHVFTAFPPQAAGRTLVGVPTASAREPDAGPSRGASRGRSGAPRPAPAASAEAVRARSGPPAIYRPPAPPPGQAASAGAARAPVLRRDTVGNFEARLRRHARARWALPAAVLLVVAGSGAAWRLLARPDDGAGERVRGEALALLARDDLASVERAAALLEGALRHSPFRAGAAERAMADVLRGAAAADESELLLARRAAREAERERLRLEQPEGWREAERAVIAEAQALEGEIHAREERARTLATSALETLRALRRRVGDAPEVARGFALAQAARGDRDAARRLARAGAASDPWLALAEGWADARDPDPAARERAVARLSALVQARPELLRGRYLLARAQAALGRRGEALAVVEALLEANPSHEGARRLRAELTAPPPEPLRRAEATATTSEARPVGNGPSQPRKAVAHPGAATPQGVARPTLAPAAIERAPQPPAPSPEVPPAGTTPAPPATQSAPVGVSAAEQLPPPLEEPPPTPVAAPASAADGG